MSSLEQKIKYAENAKKKQQAKYYSEENILKRRKKQLEYQRRAKEKQKLKGGISKFSDQMKEKHYEDEKFYESVWKSRLHYCENCGCFLGDSFKDKNGKIMNIYRYAHIIPKSTYPYLRHYPKNIKLLCLNCHTLFDTAPKSVVEKLKCYDAQEIEQLKELHKKLEQENNTQYK